MAVAIIHWYASLPIGGLVLTSAKWCWSHCFAWLTAAVPLAVSSHIKHSQVVSVASECTSALFKVTQGRCTHLGLSMGASCSRHVASLLFMKLMILQNIQMWMQLEAWAPHTFIHLFVVSLPPTSL